MNEVEVLDIARDAMMTMLIVSMPILLVGLAVGLVVSVFQTLTHIQEMTLTFIPKIVAMVGAAIFLMPWISHMLMDYATKIFSNAPM